MNGPEEGAQSREDGISEAARRWPEHAAEIAQHAETAGIFRRWTRMIRQRQEERDRYRLAWLSARRRAALESVYATEALAIRDAELATERARQASFVAELQPVVRTRMDEVRRLRAFAADVKLVRGRTICDGNEIDHLRDVHANLHELEAADREGRPYVSHLDRTYPAADGA